ncbi:MAG: hypothetical protein QOE69_1832 [Thermoleophilaceae bacterium]|jgi:hypothetical protein|nr:hypothetical protein [Thermoleophilaceae bacterium]
MEAVKPGGTREQTAVASWFDRAELARARLATVEQLPSLVPCFDLWASAVGRFGECELHARAADRSRALSVFEERRKWQMGVAEARNQAGIEDLAALRETLPELGREIGSLELDQDRVGAVMDDFERQYRETLADWEMKGSDAKKLMDQFIEISEAIRSGGLAALPEHLDRKFDELAAERQTPERGNRDNMPWWKWIILAGAVGWTVAAAIVWAVYSGYRGVIAVGWWIIEIIHWVAFVLFC